MRKRAHAKGKSTRNGVGVAEMTILRCRHMIGDCGRLSESWQEWALMTTFAAVRVIRMNSCFEDGGLKTEWNSGV